MRIGPFGVWEILILVLVLFLIFGASRLPKISRGLADSVREFRKGIKDTSDNDDGKSGGPKATRLNQPPEQATNEAAVEEKQRVK